MDIRAPEQQYNPYRVFSRDQWARLSPPRRARARRIMIGDAPRPPALACYLGLQVLVAASQASVDLQSAGPVGAGLDGEVCAKAGSANTVTKLARSAADIVLRMVNSSIRFR